MSRAEFEALPVEQQQQMLQGYRMHFKALENEYNHAIYLN